MKHFLVAVSIILLHSVSFGFIDDAKLTEAMATLDKAYIPALGMTGKTMEEYTNALKAMERFKVAWADFKKTDLRQYSGWNKTSGKIDNAVIKSEKTLKSGNMQLSHASLETVRETFLEFRKSNKISYYLDDFTVYHEIMEKLLVSFQKSGKGEKSMKTGKQLMELTSKAVSSWIDVENNMAMATAFGFDQGKMNKLKEYVNMEKTSLSDLRKALEERDQPKMKESLKNIKPAFIKAFFLFGDFGE